MEKYCITFDQAKKLRELEFKTPAQYWWVVYSDTEPFTTDLGSLMNNAVVKYPAYHIGELGEILGDRVASQMEFDDGTWNVTSQPFIGKLLGKFTTEAQARGQLLIYLLENNLL